MYRFVGVAWVVIQLSLIQFGSVQFSSVQVNSVSFSTIQSAQFSSAQLVGERGGGAWPECSACRFSKRAIQLFDLCVARVAPANVLFSCLIIAEAVTNAQVIGHQTQSLHFSSWVGG